MPDTLVRPAFHWVPEHDSTAGGEAAGGAGEAAYSATGRRTKKRWSKPRPALRYVA